MWFGLLKDRGSMTAELESRGKLLSALSERPAKYLGKWFYVELNDREGTLGTLHHTHPQGSSRGKKKQRKSAR